MCKAGITQDLQNVENIRITECGDFDSRDYESRDYESHPSSPTDEKLDELAGRQLVLFIIGHFSLLTFKVTFDSGVSQILVTLTHLWLTFD